jgi:hypothetical protein
VNLDTESEGLSWSGVSNVLLADSLFSLGSQNGAPYFIQSSSWYIVRGNVFRYLRKRMTVLESHDGLIEGNHSTRDFKLPLVKPGDSGGLDADFVERLTILNNTFDSDGKVTQLNDGETINSQGCNSLRQSLGSVSQSSSSELADSTAHWLPLEGYIVAIVTGRDAGEWRTVVRNTSDSLAVDLPWRTPPAPGSNYVITRWSARALLVKGNRLTNNPKGVWLYCGGTDLAVIDNALNNSSGIWLRSDQRLADHRFNLLLGAQVANNSIDSSIADRPAFVAIELARVKTPNLFGTGVFNVNVRGNSVNCNYSAPPNPYLLDGFWNDVTTPDSYPISNFSQPGIVGTLFQNNTLSGCGDAYNLSTGDIASVILFSSVSKRDVNDQITKGAPVGSEQSYIGY